MEVENLNNNLKFKCFNGSKELHVAAEQLPFFQDIDKMKNDIIAINKKYNLNITRLNDQNIFLQRENRELKETLNIVKNNIIDPNKKYITYTLKDGFVASGNDYVYQYIDSVPNDFFEGYYNIIDNNIVQDTKRKEWIKHIKNGG
jgi:hypothetical protein